VDIDIFDGLFVFTELAWQKQHLKLKPRLPIAPKPVLGWRLYVQCERGTATEVRSRSALQILGRRWHRLTPAAKQPYLAGAVVPRRLDEDDDVVGDGSGDDTEEEQPAATQGNTTRYASLLFNKRAPSLVLVSGFLGRRAPLNPISSSSFLSGSEARSAVLGWLLPPTFIT